METGIGQGPTGYTCLICKGRRKDMTFNVEVVLKGRDFAVTEAISVPHGEPSTWTEAAVYDVLVEVLRTIDRVQNPGNETDRMVVLRGFSWIVEPIEDEVVIAM